MEATVTRGEARSVPLERFISLIRIASRSAQEGNRDTVSEAELEPSPAKAPSSVRTVRTTKGATLAGSIIERTIGESFPFVPFEPFIGFLGPGEMEELLASVGSVSAVRVEAEDGRIAYGVSGRGSFLLVDTGERVLILVESRSGRETDALSLSLYALMAAYGLDSVEDLQRINSHALSNIYLAHVEEGQVAELWDNLRSVLQRFQASGREQSLPRELDKVRMRLHALVGDLRELMGQTRSTASEWPVLLVFGLLVGVDPARPPMSVHVVGEIGTFKTTAPSFLARALRSYSIVARCRCKSPRDAYETVLRVLEERLGIASTELDRRVGGMITRVKTSGRTLEVGFSLLHLLSHSTRRGGADRLVELVRDLEGRGFEVSVEEEPVSVRVFSHQEVANLEDYRFKYVPDPALGVLQVSDAFGGHIVVVDEGSRDPYALEALLTKMSYTAPTDTVRLIVVTDNIEPFMNVAADPRYDPVHDRTILSVTRPSFSITRAVRARRNLPSSTVSLEELLAARIFLDSITVPDHLLAAVLIAGNLLMFQFTLGSVEGRGVYARLLGREEKAPVKFDYLSDVVGLRARFIGGGRFVFHTLLLARFLAFMDGKASVSVEHVARALFYTARSRIVPEGVSSYSEYRAASVKLALAVSKLVRELVVEDGYAFVALQAARDLVSASRGDMASRERALEAITRLSTDPTHVTLATAITALDLALADGLEDASRLPDIIQYMLADYLLVRGDPTELLDIGIPEEVVQEILEQRKTYTAGGTG